MDEHGFSPETTNRGNPRCPYCKKTYKSYSACKKHIKERHQKAARESERKREVEELRERNRVLEEKDRGSDKVVKRYGAVVYCPNCQSVDSVNIPVGATAATAACFRCGTTPGYKVTQVNVNPGTYK